MAEYIFYVTPLTPLHLGSGEQLEPFEYVITDQTLYRFTMEGLMLALPRLEQETFVEVVGQSVPATRRFVSQHAAVARQVARWQAAVTPAAGELYEGRLASGEGHPELLTTMRTGGRLYLPGSSLKGALRTALLYQNMPKPNPSRDAAGLEKEVFRFDQIPEDPFRAFKLGDGAPLAGQSRVHRVAVNTRRQGSWKEDITLLVETVPGQLSEGVSETSHPPVSFADDFYRLRPEAFRLTPKDILSACRRFYGRHLVMERSLLARLAPVAYAALTEHAANLPPHACLVRLGWGSGRDATTVSYGLEGHKSPDSRRLTDDNWPLGWAELAIFDPSGQPLEVGEIVASLPTVVPAGGAAGPQVPPPPPAPPKYPLNTTVTATIVGEWVKGEVAVTLPEGEKGFLKISRKRLESLGQTQVSLVVVRIRNDIYYLELP